MKQQTSRTQTLILTGLFAAMSFVLSAVIVFPNMAPIQHAFNVLAAVYLGPGYAFLQALITGLLRMMTGRSINAVIGAVFGAYLAGVAYLRTGKLVAAVLGEAIGTGIISALVVYWVMKLVAGVFAYYIPFFLPSSIIGSLLGAFLSRLIDRRRG
ncbi:energy coupling factor transporter S component ThiW [Suicoccus acidiformans]|uniref:Energy coupling factor transporter S component ThiW n=1 Tax=Suicoccus acidiformans TaxID=2036206 RepID=A0A347WHY5_9LACT|nr:energy coupling factor transporter S component ThiW [Suicoccus acidiformans]AXY24692.1 energy coupling factor transporter S component ThiW [Suicoccus acidiformans]